MAFFYAILPNIRRFKAIWLKKSHARLNIFLAQGLYQKTI